MMNCPIPHMSYKEIVCMMTYLDTETEMLEIGTGNSTPLLAKHTKSLVAIEHNKEWAMKVREMLVEHAPNSKVEYIQVDPNWPHIHLFNPAQPGQFADYTQRIEQFEDERFDVILVDGRDRVNCAKAAFHALKSNGIMFVHDYWNRRSKYGEIENIEGLSLVNEGTGAEGFTLAVFRKS